jgi:hypothetical protein
VLGPKRDRGQASFDWSTIAKPTVVFQPHMVKGLPQTKRIRRLPKGVNPVNTAFTMINARSRCLTSVPMVLLNVIKLWCLSNRTPDSGLFQGDLPPNETPTASLHDKILDYDFLLEIVPRETRGRSAEVVHTDTLLC